MMRKFVGLLVIMGTVAAILGATSHKVMDNVTRYLNGSPVSWKQKL
jgi:hypothetical protein